MNRVYFIQDKATQKNVFISIDLDTYTEIDEEKLHQAAKETFDRDGHIEINDYYYFDINSDLYKRLNKSKNRYKDIKRLEANGQIEIQTIMEG